MPKWFWRKDFIIQRCKFPISVLSPFEKMFCLLFKQTLVSFPKECSVSSIRWSREKKSIFFTFYLLSPFGQSLYLKKIYFAQTLFVPCWNLSSGSGLNCQCIHKISLLSPLGTDCSPSLESMQLLYPWMIYPIFGWIVLEKKDFRNL